MDDAKTPAELIRLLDDAAKSQADLAGFSPWSPDPEEVATVGFAKLQTAEPGKVVKPVRKNKVLHPTLKKAARSPRKK
ncbi:hypothetical protein J2W28_004473 [Variovorax boronicumulans]|uniref:hypothetical protein n=1 Tax=Variovorax boronicumulans TaxID=436515 RepID=UPI002780C85D|nr:hypothetical protein [Variovorax boronicumulans]MDP9993824.1 hypothetical protein [Variovorax boronicumulans]MDQ0005311.1 hypothetical protein [Variovorax boronicumulans]